MYGCITCHVITFLFIVPENVLNLTISTSGSQMAGSNFSTICLVMEAIPGLLQKPTALWVNNNSEPIANSSDIMHSTFRNNTFAIAVLTFSPLKLSHELLYKCVGRLMSLGNTISVEDQNILVVRCK